MKPLIRRSVAAMSGYTPGEQPRIPDLVKLNTNENPYPPSPAVARALAEVDPARLRLYPDPVCLRLRERLAAAFGVAVEQVFVGNGSDEILALCTRAFVEDDEAIGYFEPSYSLYPVLADIRAVAKAPVELGEGFSWRMPAGYRAALFLLANPNAPTGLLYPPETVAAFCRTFEGVVLIDEAYVDFARCSALDWSRDLPNVLVMRTLSKSYSLAGLRVGWAIGAAPLIRALHTIKDSYNVDLLAQVAAEAAIGDMAGMRRNVARIRASRDRLTAALQQRGFSVVPSETNFLFAHPPTLTAQAWFEALRRLAVLVRWFPGPRTGAYLRITVGTDEEVDRLLRACDVILAGQAPAGDAGAKA